MSPAHSFLRGGASPGEESRAAAIAARRSRRQPSCGSITPSMRPPGSRARRPFGEKTWPAWGRARGGVHGAEERIQKGDHRIFKPPQTTRCAGSPAGGRHGALGRAPRTAHRSRQAQQLGRRSAPRELTRRGPNRPLVAAAGSGFKATPSAVRPSGGSRSGARGGHRRGGQDATRAQEVRRALEKLRVDRKTVMFTSPPAGKPFSTKQRRLSLPRASPESCRC